MPRPRKQRAASGPVGRGVWSGSITFGLVTIQVELYSASLRPAGAMRLLGPDGIPLAREFVCPADGRVVSDDEIARGYEVQDGKFVVVTDEELEKLAPRRSRDIELTRFVDRDAIDPAFFVRTYFVVPAGDQTKAYHLLAEAMETNRRAALANFVMRGKAYVVALFADRGLLRAETLRFSDELRAPEQIGIPVPHKVEATRVTKINRAIAKLKTAKIDENELTDDATARLLELARKKLARGVDVVRAPDLPEDESGLEAEPGGEVIDLLALIRKRLGETPDRRPKQAGSTRSSVTKISSRARTTSRSKKRR